ncbi:hypothetical protein AB733_20055 [Photobacterium swingsii]|uniref:Uncharacterized protein n=1 Tax=Photobacterium swingsii TaxID=680026 RepID=A0A0J8V6L1_9GAMM|nr:hypothetical protein [Photobacterium swingsii]KMV29073.1 hypothetical protein AB733_20055 [Photobacterium swingsii]PSW19105.1 hypothetical protein C9I94_23835 [Photobacterium swingsii]
MFDDLGEALGGAWDSVVSGVGDVLELQGKAEANKTASAAPELNRKTNQAVQSNGQPLPTTQPGQFVINGRHFMMAGGLMGAIVLIVLLKGD